MNNTNVTSLALLDLNSAAEINTAFVLCTPDSTNTILFASDELYKQTGYSALDVLGRDVRFLQGSEINSDVQTMLNELLSIQQDGAVCMHYVTKNGRSFLVEITVRHLFASDRKLLAVAFINRII